MYWNEDDTIGNNTQPGLTLTWDVLKLQNRNHYTKDCKININMRCIEIIKGKLGINAVLD